MPEQSQHQPKLGGNSRFYMHENVVKLTHIPKQWMLRSCECYKDEYKGCKSIKGRFYQMYINGEFSDCQPMKDNYEDCTIIDLGVSEKAEEAAIRIIEREEKRIVERLSGHFANDVWEKRTEPPKDWNKPLPPELAKSSENSVFKSYMENQGELAFNQKLNVIGAKIGTSLPNTPCVIL